MEALRNHLTSLAQLLAVDVLQPHLILTCWPGLPTTTLVRLPSFLVLYLWWCFCCIGIATKATPGLDVKLIRTVVTVASIGGVTPLAAT